MAPVVITKLRDMLCCCVLCLSYDAAQRVSLARCGPRIRGSLGEVGWLGTICRRVARDEREDRLMGNWVNVAFNRGNESLGRVGLPNQRNEMR
jgi:hypothetical protein